MKITKRFENEFQREGIRASEGASNLVADVVDGIYPDNELVELASHIEKIYFDLDFWKRSTVLFLLGRIDENRACILAKRDLENAYDKTRVCAGYLNQIIVSIDSTEHFIDSLNAMEVEKALRIAYALVNKREVLDGDLRAPEFKV